MAKRRNRKSHSGKVKRSPVAPRAPRQPTAESSPSAIAHVSEPAAPDPSPAPSELLPLDETLLERANTLWQFGDWEGLAEIELDALHHHPDRAKLALLAAEGHLQLGQVQEARALLKEAQAWGVAPKTVHRVLIAGVYNSLGKASFLKGEVNQAMDHFATSVRVALPGTEHRLSTKARALQQVEQLVAAAPDAGEFVLGVGEFAEALLPRGLNPYQNPTVDSKVTNSFPHSGGHGTEQRNWSHSLESHYNWDPERRIWAQDATVKFGYSDGDAVEEQILEAVRGANDVSLYSKDLKLQEIKNWASRYHLSADRANLLRPFANKIAQSSILELGCGCGAITRYLGELGADVVALEGSQRRATIAAERCRDLPNVVVIADQLQDLPIAGQFDVVTLIGVLEYSRLYINRPDPVQSVLAKAKQYLKQDGILIVAIENQLGLKYLAGAPEDHGVGIMAGVNDLYGNRTVVTFGHSELRNRILNAGFAETETYLPFPDYKLPILVVHPLGYGATAEPASRANIEHVPPSSQWNLASLLRGTVSVDRQPIPVPLFSLERAWPLVFRNGLLPSLANSHLFVAKCSSETTTTDTRVMATYCSPSRAREHSQQIEFLAHPHVLQDPANQPGNQHLAVDPAPSSPTPNFVRRRSLGNTMSTLDPAQVMEEPYMVGTIHADALHDVVHHPQWSLNDLIPWVTVWIDSLRENCIGTDEHPVELGWKEYDGWLPNNYLDAIPRNLLLKASGERVFFDLEWREPHPLPLKLVVYRGLLITFGILTSVAAPKDPDLVDLEILTTKLMETLHLKMTALDFGRFMPIIDRVSKRSQGLALADPPRVTAYPSRTMKVRPVLTDLATASASTTLTLYLKTEDEHYSETRALYSSYLLDGRLTRLVLWLPKVSDQRYESEPAYRAQMIGKLSGLRVDISDCPGFFLIHEMGIESAESEILWKWDFDRSHLRSVQGLQFFDIPGESQTGILSINRDPQFEIILPEEVLPKLWGASFFIKVAGFPHQAR